MENGWIKLSRSITRHWLWHDAERLRWWLDLLMMAQWEDHQWIDNTHVFTLRRGQLVASISFLAQRWERSKPTILAFLKTLEKENMIKRELPYRKTAILTICNYDRYQAYDQGGLYQSLYQSPYQSIEQSIEQSLDTKQEDKENKELKKYDVVGGRSGTEFFNDFFSEKRRATLEQICASRKFGSLDNFRQLAREVLAEWEITEEHHSSLSEARRHLINQCSKKLNLQSKNTQNLYNNGKTAISRADAEQKRRDDEFAEFIRQNLARPSEPEHELPF